MSYLFNKVEFATTMSDSLLDQVSLDEGAQIDGIRMLQLLSGVLVETLLLFDDPDEGMIKSFDDLEFNLACAPAGGIIAPAAIPPSYIIDQETEKGRLLAKDLFEEWLECAHQFHDLVLFSVHHAIVRMEQSGQKREELLRLFIEFTTKALSFEIAAQEICDIMIDGHIGEKGWTISDCVSGLSATAGRSLALSQNACEIFSMPAMPDKLDQVAYVMTQEAVRLGVPAGTDWRFGLAANDCHVMAPYHLMRTVHPHLQAFFRVIELHDPVDQAVAVAKAAGRMLAIASGGEDPDLEPVIAKPLAMAAMTDTYRVVCQEELLVLNS